MHADRFSVRDVLFITGHCANRHGAQCTLSYWLGLGSIPKQAQSFAGSISMHAWRLTISDRPDSLMVPPLSICDS